jgi:hypothetical protein
VSPSSSSPFCRQCAALGDPPRKNIPDHSDVREPVSVVVETVGHALSLVQVALQHVELVFPSSQCSPASSTASPNGTAKKLVRARTLFAAVVGRCDHIGPGHVAHVGGTE